MVRSHKIRIYPTREQEVQLKKTVGTVRYAYNWGLTRWELQYEEFKTGKRTAKPSANSLIKEWAIEKPEWAHEVAMKPQQRAFFNLWKAYVNFFKGKTNRPTYHKKGVRDCFYCPNDTVKWFPNKRISIPGVGRVKLSEELRFSGKIMSYNVSTFANKWYVSVSVELQEMTGDTPDTIIGIDVGLDNPAWDSDNNHLQLPEKDLEKLEKKLKRAQKALSRSQRNSHNRARRALKKQKVQDRINNIRSDVTHKYTTKVCKNHATVVIEDLDIEGMIKDAPRRSIRRGYNASLMRTVLYQLSYKAKKLVKAPRFFPSSKTCSHCGAIKSDLTVKQRVYKCPSCGLEIGRDYNAALNLMKIGLVKSE